MSSPCRCFFFNLPFNRFSEKPKTQNPKTKQEAGYPWALRRLATDVGSKSVDIIHAYGGGRSGTATTASLRITTVNARGAWTRTLTPGREVSQRDAEGRAVRTSCWWEGGVHKAVHAAADGRREVESWRSVDGGHQIVRVALRVRGPPLVPAMAGGGAASPAPHGAAAAVAAAAAAAALPTRRSCGAPTCVLSSGGAVALEAREAGGGGGGGGGGAFGKLAGLKARLARGP